MKTSEIEKLIHEEYKQGNIVTRNINGLEGCPIDEFIKQPADGILYDLSRTEVEILTGNESDPKWINDFAVAKVIRALKSRIEELEINNDKP
jgi:hypothetical protein